MQNRITLTPEQKELDGRLVASHPGSVLALTSIIQGGVLAVLAALLMDRHFHLSSRQQWFTIPTAILTVLGVWQEYLMGTSIFRWTPRLRDSLIPFLLGLTQVGIAYAAVQKQSLMWSCAALVLFYIFGGWAFSNTARRVVDDSNPLVRGLEGPSSRSARLCITTAALYLLLGGVSFADFQVHARSYIVIGWLVVLAFVRIASTLAQFVRMNCYWNVVLASVNGSVRLTVFDEWFFPQCASSALLKSKPKPRLHRAPKGSDGLVSPYNVWA